MAHSQDDNLAHLMGGEFNSADMATPRTALIDELTGLLHGDLRVVEPRTGWPALVEIQIGSGTVLASLHMGAVGGSQRGRDDVERRYQNPATCDPIQAIPGTIPLVLGLWKETRPILVAHDADRNVGRGGTRRSFFVSLQTLNEAVNSGWAEYVNTGGERIVAFWPSLLPVYVEMASGGVLLPASQTLQVIHAADARPDEPASTERARRAASVLVRDARFRASVVNAYGGACAMCGLGLGIVQGAHIYPASAPSSPDTVTNGLSLCPNHHALFDLRMIWIEPVSHRVVVHPGVIAQAQFSPDSNVFVSTTLPVLRSPADPASRASDDMILARNAYYDDAYAWCGH